MMFGRTATARCARQQLQRKARFTNFRFQSTASHTPSPSTGNPALIGGLAGGAAAFVTGYTWYHFSGAKTLVDTSKATQAYAEEAKRKFAQNAPEPNEAFRWLRNTLRGYADFIPGARGYVDTTFDSLEKIRNDHENEFDQIVRDTYDELGKVWNKEGLNTDSATKALQILQNCVRRLFDLAENAAENIWENNPQLKHKVGGSFDQLKQMGDAYGPQATEEVNQTYQQISSIVQRGATTESLEEIKNLIREKKQKLQKLGDEAWQKGLEESQQYLEKKPELKQLIEENADTLREGNFKELWSKVRESASSGKVDDLEKYVREKLEQSKNSNDLSSLDKWLNMIPGGSNVIPQLQSLHTIARKKGTEAENVLKETLEELQSVLEKRTEQVEKLAEEAKQESK